MTVSSQLCHSVAPMPVAGLMACLKAIPFRGVMKEVCGSSSVTVAGTRAEGARRPASVVRRSVVEARRSRARDWRGDEGAMSWARW